MFRKKFRAEPAIALTVLYAALSLGARANLPRQGVYWPLPQDQRAGLLLEPEQPAAAKTAAEKPQEIASTGSALQMVHSVQLTGVSRFTEDVFEPYLHYLKHRPLAMPMVETVIQAVTAHYQVNGHPLPRIFACVDDGRAGHLILAVFEA
ncbi:hemolysin activation/secretion protein [Silvimonas terrae]|uniref:Hemolysin activation/secretion protein n=1 Tax=Silvimonas terrae TaxID=300266 RepID=A0A840RAK0_9NEIS|nr:POTRA domain-containing protein [Silvimonas terrae]MBB5189624.1 hemolysin activation/secretion protein [Silvimonas terrae]